MNLEFDEQELDQGVLKTLKRTIEQMEKKDVRTKEIGDDAMPSEIKKRIERLVDGN